jgi:hypothetical protein
VDGYISMITNLNPEDGGYTASETLVSNHLTTVRNNPENPYIRKFCLKIVYKSTNNYKHGYGAKI